MSEKKIIKIPPSRANIKVKGPLETVKEVNLKIFKDGLSDVDIAPIDWRLRTTLSRVLNQGDCGNCWAMSTTAVLADRFIIGKSLKNLTLNPIFLTQCFECDKIRKEILCNYTSTPGEPDVLVLNSGCNGGIPYLAGKFLEVIGIPNCGKWEDFCQVNSTCSILSECNTFNCDNTTTYRVKLNSTSNLTAEDKVYDSSKNITVRKINSGSTILNIKRALTRGPVIASFFIAPDFAASMYGYKWKKTNGVYINGEYEDELNQSFSQYKDYVGLKDKWGDVDENSGHAVCIIGWGIENINNKQIPYWIVRNSWGVDWVDGGFCKFGMNNNGERNNKVGLDIPISKYTDKGSVEFYGGCTSIEADITGGAPFGTIFPLDIDIDYTQKTILNFLNHKTFRYIALYVCLFVLLSLILFRK